MSLTRAMTSSQAQAILVQNGFTGYFGPGYRTSDAVYEYLCAHPRGRGISPGRFPLYVACRVYWAARTRTRSWKDLNVVR